MLIPQIQEKAKCEPEGCSRVKSLTYQIILSLVESVLLRLRVAAVCQICFTTCFALCLNVFILYINKSIVNFKNHFTHIKDLLSHPDRSVPHRYGYKWLSLFCTFLV